MVQPITSAQPSMNFEPEKPMVFEPTTSQVLNPADDANLVNKVNAINSVVNNNGDVTTDGIEREFDAVVLGDNDAVRYGTVNQALIRNVENIVGNVDSSTITAAEAIRNEQEYLSSPDALEKVYVNALTLAPSESIKNMISNEYLNHLVIRMQSETSLGEDFSNFFGHFLPDEMKDVSDFTTGSITNTLDDLNKMVFWFQSRTPEEKIALAPALIEQALEAADGNEQKAAELVHQFLGTEGADIGGISSIVWDGIDLLIFADLLKLAVNGGRAVHSIANTIRVAKEVGNVKVGGKMTAAAMHSETGRAAAGVDKVVAQANTAAFSHEGSPLILGTTDNVAVDAVKELEQLVAEARKSVTHNPTTSEELLGSTSAARGSFAERSPILEEFTIPDPYASTPISVYDKMVNTFGNVTGGISQEARLAQVDEALAEFNVRGETIATPAERAAFKTKYIDDWADNANLIEADRNITVSAKPVFIRDEVDGMTVQVTDYNGEVHDVLLKFNKNDLTFHKEFVGAGGGGIVSPDVRFRALEGVVETATQLGRQEARNIQLAGKAYNAAIKGINNKGREKLNSILLQGDETGRAYTREQLMYDGVTTENGTVKLTAKEADSYQASRRIFDFLYETKNQQLMREFEFNGFGFAKFESDLTLFTEEGVFLAPLVKSEKNLPVRIYDFEKGVTVERGSADLQIKLDDEGYKLVKFRTPVRMETTLSGESHMMDIGIIKAEGIGPLPARILAKHSGYVPKIYEDTYFVARSRQGATLNGVEHAGGLWRTEGFFGGKAEAEAWRAKELAKRGTSADDLVITRDRNLPEEVKADQALMSYGTLFGGSRSKRTLWHGSEGMAAPRVNAFKALERNLTHVANAGPMSEFRLGLIEKFRKSTEKMLDDPTNWRSKVKPGVPPKTEQFIEGYRDWIYKQLRFQTENERVWEGTMTRMADMAAASHFGALKIPGSQLVSRGGKTLEQAALDLSSVDPAGMLKAASFHTLLGAFSPVQLLVQSQNFIIAASIKPTMIPVLLPRYSALRMAMLNKNNEAYVRHLAKAALMPADDFVKLVNRYDKTGFHQSVKMTADTSAATQGFSLDATAMNKAMGTAGKALDRSLLFYTEGERFGRGYSWLLAESEWRAANAGKTANALADRAISDRALSLTMNMDRANAAIWQEGMLGVMTQFKQVTSKFAETLFGMNRKLTRVERMKMMAGQFVAYGTVGIGFGAGDWLEQQYAAARGINLGDATQEELALIHGGVMEMMFEMMFDVRVSADRFSMIRGVSDMFDQLADEDAAFMETLAGPFYTVPSRAFEAVDKVATMYGSPVDIILNPKDSVAVLSVLAEVFSSWRNFKAAQRWEELGYVTDSRGRKLFNLTDDDMNLIWIKKFGATPSRVSDLYRMDQFNKDTAEDIAELEGGLTILAQALVDGTFTRPEQFSAAYTRLISSTSLSDKAAKKAIANYRKKLSQSGTRENDLKLKMLKNIFEGLTDEQLPSLEVNAKEEPQ